MKTIIILDYVTAEAHIVYTNKAIDDIEEYLTEEMNFNLGDIHYMVSEGKMIINRKIENAESKTRCYNQGCSVIHHMDDMHDIIKNLQGRIL
tara:strand:+ start:832 stop:1107 length:276 start_codon:yes stop_codon:yes gene_type:complete